MFSKSFWIEAAERAIETAAQSVATFFTLGAATPLPALTWTIVWQAALVGAGFSIVTSVASANFGKTESPSLVAGETIGETMVTPTPNGGDV
ncbi:MAG: holin [Acidimicrobiia bacterium]